MKWHFIVYSKVNFSMINVAENRNY